MRWAAAAACVLAAAQLAACNSTQSPAAALRAWTSQSSFRAAVTTLLADSDAVHAAIASREAAKAVRTVCAELVLDVQGTNDYLPTSDAQLTAILSSAYGHFGHAASTCYEGATSAQRLAAADAERRLAVGLLVQAVLRDEAVIGRSLHLRGIP